MVSLNGLMDQIYFPLMFKMLPPNKSALYTTQLPRVRQYHTVAKKNRQRSHTYTCAVGSRIISSSLDRNTVWYLYLDQHRCSFAHLLIETNYKNLTSGMYTADLECYQFQIDSEGWLWQANECKFLHPYITAVRTLTIITKSHTLFRAHVCK